MIKLFDKKHKKKTISFALVIGLYVIVEILLNTNNLSNLIQSLLVPVCCYIVAALALNMVVGISGNLSLGQAGFMSVGAFTSAIVVGLLHNVISSKILLLIIAVLIAGISASLFGLIVGIPVLKLEGDYLAIVTLAFGQIIKSLINNLYVAVDNGIKTSFVDNNINLSSSGEMIVKGPTGAVIMSRLSSFTAGVVLIIITLIIIYNLIDSKHGRAILACRDNEVAATSVGIKASKYKILVFVLSAGLCGMAGAIYALNYSSITAAKFDYNASIMILVYVVLGGLGNMPGTIISTIVLLLLPELLRGLKDYRMLIYAIVLIVIMLIKNNEKINNIFKRIMKKDKTK